MLGRSGTLAAGSGRWLTIASHERVHITRNGREYVVLISAEDLESIEATMELLTDQAAQERVRRAEDEVARGDVLDEHDIRDLLAQRRQPE